MYSKLATEIVTIETPYLCMYMYVEIKSYYGCNYSQMPQLWPELSIKYKFCFVLFCSEKGAYFKSILSHDATLVLLTSWWWCTGRPEEEE